MVFARLEAPALLPGLCVDGIEVGIQLPMYTMPFAIAGDAGTTLPRLPVLNFQRCAPSCWFLGIRRKNCA